MIVLEFKKFLEQNSIGYHNDGLSGFNHKVAAYLSSDQTGSEASPSNGMIGHPQFLPSIDMAIIDTGIPTVKRTSTITNIEKNRNPLFISFKDGTRIYLTWDEWRRIKGTPEIGKKATITFQRNSKDDSKTTSKISQITIH